MQYVKELDGIRAVAILLVMLFHAGSPFAKGGFIGVDVFFLISGYLITSILISNRQLTQKKHYIEFMANRCIRLLPALIACILLYLVLSQFIWTDYQHHIRDSLLSLLYITNYTYPAFDAPYFLRHTWSLALEFQFYLIWPLAVYLLTKRSTKESILILMITYSVISILRSQVALDHWENAYFHLETRSSGLILGSIIAFYMKSYPVPALPAWTSWASIIGLCYISFTTEWGDAQYLTTSLMLGEILGATLLISSITTKSPNLILSNPTMIYIGKISYGLYLYHYPVMLYLRNHFDWPYTLALSLPIAFITAIISYHTIEKWASNCRKKQILLPRKTLT